MILEKRKKKTVATGRFRRSEDICNEVQWEGNWFTICLKFVCLFALLHSAASDCCYEELRFIITKGGFLCRILNVTLM